MMKENSDPAIKQNRNSYRTLMTRGQKGCYVYCTDSELASYLKVRLSKVYSQQKEVTELLVAEHKGNYNL